MKKKILFIINYFYPEVASIAQLYTELCESMAEEFDITVICAVPCYTGEIEDKYLKERFYFEEYKNIKIIRVRVTEFTKTNKLSRIKHIISYFVNSISAIKKAETPDVVFTCSQPPILGGLLGFIAKKKTKAKLIYNIQDFNPEQTEAVGYSKSRLLLNLARALDNFSCRNSDLIITVGRDMRKTLKARLKNPPYNIVINNWINEKQVYPLDKTDTNIVEFKKKYGLENKFVMMYSGNIGLFYDLENIIKVFKKFKNRQDVVFAFVGNGAVKPELCEYAERHDMDNVVFIPYQPKKDLIYSLNSADVHFVVNAKGIKGVSVPSKIYGVLATNVPIFGVLENGSEAWHIIEESGCGVLCEAGDYDSIEENIEKILEDKDGFVSSHSTGYEYMMKRFTKDKSIQKYTDAIKNL